MSNVFPSFRQLQDKFVALLRLLLLWDPKARGGPVLENGKRKCFDVLEKIVNTVVNFFLTPKFGTVSINFCITTLSFFSKPIYSLNLLSILFSFDFLGYTCVLN